MMTMFTIVLCVYLSLISVVFGGCHTGTTDADDKRLGIETTDVSNAGTDSKIYANIYANGQWNGWRKLDNSGCDDFKRGAVDYFDDFEDITQEWEGIGLYNCGNDASKIESIYWWDGSSEIKMSTWKSGVFGPFGAKCLFNNNAQASTTGQYANTYSDIKITQDECPCDGVIFGTGTTGQLWDGTLPGKPDCSGETGLVVPVNNHINNNYEPEPSSSILSTTTLFEKQLLNYLMIAVIIGVILFVSNSCLITAIYIKKDKSSPSSFSKIDYDDKI